MINGSEVRTGSVKVGCVCLSSLKGGYGAMDGCGFGIGLIFSLFCWKLFKSSFCSISDGLRKTALHFLPGFFEVDLNLGCLILLAFEEIFSYCENFSND